jgi:3-isopropylmalate/(R)-2-methylmalate dehydratase small subunit
MPEKNAASEQTSRAVVSGRGVVVRGDDIDTDRIIPARFMKTISFEELGRFAFHDERFEEGGARKRHPFNEPRSQGASVLLVNRNFGCGSSREHAPQTLMRWGIRALIGESFAEIFSGNCTAMGLPAARVPHEQILRLMDRVEQYPDSEVRIDLRERTVSIRGGDAPPESLAFEMPEGDRQSLVSGDWDTTTVLLANLDAIRRTAASLPYMSEFASR